MTKIEEIIESVFLWLFPPLIILSIIGNILGFIVFSRKKFLKITMMKEILLIT
jgi:hypothetical protein